MSARFAQQPKSAFSSKILGIRLLRRRSRHPTWKKITSEKRSKHHQHASSSASARGSNRWYRRRHGSRSHGIVSDVANVARAGGADTGIADQSWRCCGQSEDAHARTRKRLERGGTMGDCSPTTVLQQSGAALTSIAAAPASTPPCDRRLSNVMPDFSSPICKKNKSKT
jgi:hypothetical protein